MKILLYSVVPPTIKYSGGLMLHHLCSLLPENNWCCVSVHSASVNGTPSGKYKNVPHLDLIYPLPPLSKNFRERLQSQYLHRSDEELILQKIVSFAHQQKVDLIWAVLQGSFLIQTTLPLFQRIKKPLLTQVWDDPSWALLDEGIKGKEKKKLLHLFSETVMSSRACATASEFMAKSYHRRFKIPTFALLGTISRRLVQTPGKTISSGNSLQIGLSGQIYAQDAWLALLKALDNISWQINQRTITINLIGNFSEDVKSQRPNIILLGRKSQSQTVKILSLMDLNYCPYWFDPHFRKVVTTSFPAKLTTYFASGRPAIFHGPKDSSPAKFIKSHDCGLVCDSVQPGQIISAIKTLIDDRQRYRDIALNGRIALEKYLTVEKMAHPFNEFLSHGNK